MDNAWLRRITAGSYLIFVNAGLKPPPQTEGQFFGIENSFCISLFHMVEGVRGEDPFFILYRRLL